MSIGELCIGAVIPRTGRLSRLGDPLSFVLDLLAPAVTHVVNDGRRHDLRLAGRDSRSDPAVARRAVHELVEHERAQIVLTLGGTQVLPAVADTCERVPWTGPAGRPQTWP
ncbi:hypothetical protein [Nonomuraea sp. GTA35]|uniref:hypothetical protein n=1 Tax=Nonomuraea sp. GTA35 TaxID=1676746 RepID=UPI0035C06346